MSVRPVIVAVRQLHGDGRRLAWIAVVAFVLLCLLSPRAVVSAAPPPTGRIAGPVPDPAVLQAAFHRVIEQVGPSVVSIRVYRYTPAPDADGAAEDSPLERFVVVNGSGVVIDADGLILTNEHVVHGADRIEVIFSDGKTLRGRLRGADMRSDLAVLAVARRGLRPVRFGEVGTLRRGDWTIVLGNPYGLAGDGMPSVSVGVVANLDRRLPGLGQADDRLYADMIQTTSPIHPGNSGGPLLNLAGELVGIVTAMHTRSTDDGVCFAIPLTAARRQIVRRLARGEVIRYGYLGLRVHSAAEGGVIVEDTEPGSPGERAGVRIGDRIVAYRGEPVRGAGGFALAVGLTPVGTKVVLELVRDGRRRAVTLSVAARQVSRVAALREAAILWRGLRLAPLTEDLRRRMRIPGPARGWVVLGVRAGSEADRRGIRVGDVIERIDGRDLPADGQARRLLRAQHGKVEVALRDGQRLVLGPEP